MNLNVNVLENLIHSSLSTKEIDIFLALVRYQDPSGFVPGVHYKEICECCSLCKDTFYQALRRFQELMLLDIIQMDGDYDVRIRDNQYTKGMQYIDVYNPLILSREFQDLTGNEKLLSLDLVRQIKSSPKLQKVIGREKFLQKYSQLFQVCRKTVLRYYTHIHSLFMIVFKGNNYHIRMKSFCPGKKYSDEWRERLIRMSMRRAKANASGDSFRDLVRLVKQYQGKLKDVGRLILIAIKEAAKTDNELKPALVHKLLRSHAGLGEEPSGKEGKYHNKFRFNQHDYDFDKLEKEILSN